MSVGILAILYSMCPLRDRRNGQHWLPFKILCPGCDQLKSIRVTQFEGLAVEDWKLQMSCHNGVVHTAMGRPLCRSSMQEYPVHMLELREKTPPETVIEIRDEPLNGAEE